VEDLAISRRSTRDSGFYSLGPISRHLFPRRNPPSPSLLAMASSLRSPAGKTLSITRSSLGNARSYAPGAPQCRSFSQASQRWAFKTQNFSPRSISQPSMKVRSKDLLAGQLPNDIGLLPGTFVRPLWRDMPSVFDKPRDRLQMEWTWIKAWFQNFMR
jgi:protein MBA1